MKPYTALISGDPGNKYCIDGPGVGFGYHSHFLWANRQFEFKTDAITVANMCNDAYNEGYEKAQFDMKKILGIK